MFGYEILSGESGFLILIGVMVIVMSSVAFVANRFKTFNKDA